MSSEGGVTEPELLALSAANSWEGLVKFVQVLVLLTVFKRCTTATVGPERVYRAVLAEDTRGYAFYKALSEQKHFFPASKTIVEKIKKHLPPPPGEGSESDEQAEDEQLTQAETHDASKAGPSGKANKPPTARKAQKPAQTQKDEGPKITDYFASVRSMWFSGLRVTACGVCRDACGVCRDACGVCRDACGGG
jgi:hypothetical protein